VSGTWEKGSWGKMLEKKIVHKTVESGGSVGKRWKRHSSNDPFEIKEGGFPVLVGGRIIAEKYAEGGLARQSRESERKEGKKKLTLPKRISRGWVLFKKPVRETIEKKGGGGGSFWRNGQLANSSPKEGKRPLYKEENKKGKNFTGLKCRTIHRHLGSESG